MQDVALGYQDGTDRLLLRFPQVVTHTITPKSPLAKWADPRTTAQHAAELVVIVEAVSFYNSCNMARTAVYRLPQDLRNDHVFAPIVSRAAGGTAKPVMDWQAFHAVMPTGQIWQPRAEALTELAGGLGSRPVSRPGSIPGSRLSDHEQLRASDGPTNESPSTVHAQELEIQPHGGGNRASSVGPL
jgi:hypothetical protein